MGWVNAFYKLFFGAERNIQQPNVELQLVGRKRPFEEEEEDENFSEFNKNYLNRPIKRARMEDGPEPNSIIAADPDVPKSQKKNIFQTFKSFFVGTKGKAINQELVDVEDVNVGVPGDAGENHFATNVETVDLTGDNDEDKENLPGLPQPSLSNTSSSSTLATLSSFGGFTAANFSSVAPAGCFVTTSRETRRRQEAASPENVRNRLAGGVLSRHDNFFSEKNIAKRIWRKPSEFGGIGKSGKKFRTRNAFQHTIQLQDREKYRMMLERYGVVKYSELSGKNNDFRPLRSGSLFKPGPLKASLDLTSGGRREDDTVDAKPMLTSTVVKPSLSPPTNIDLAASPVLPRDKPSLIEATRDPTSPVQSQSFLTRDDSELAAAVNEVTSPEFLERLHRKYGATARERELQIVREKGRKKKCEKDTEDVISLIDERLESHLKITQAAVDETLVKDAEFDDSQPTELPPLTKEMTAAIRRAQASRGEVLVDAFKIPITVKDLSTLSGLNWLNDEIINFYMQMIVERAGKGGNFPAVYAYNTFFYPRLMEKGFSAVKRWTKKVDVFGYDLLIIPVHLGMHWCLAVVDISRRVITYYDSMGGNNKECVKALANYLEEEHQDKKKTSLDTSDWTKKIAKKIPQQMNGSDCGMFTCKFAEYISRRARFTFSQSDMPYFRRRMVYEIVNNNLIYP